MSRPTLTLTFPIHIAKTRFLLIGRAGQAISVYWEKTSEYVLYEAVRKAVRELDDVWLCDFTATEHYHVPTRTGRSKFSIGVTRLSRLTAYFPKFRELLAAGLDLRLYCSTWTGQSRRNKIRYCSGLMVLCIEQVRLGGTNTMCYFLR